MDALEMIALGLAKQAKGEAEEKSTVVANPTLAGTEESLTGLEVDGTKYAIPSGGHIYEHLIQLYPLVNGTTNQYWGCVFFRFYNNDNTKYTTHTALITALQNAGYYLGGTSVIATAWTKCIPASGWANISSVLRNVIGVIYGYVSSQSSKRICLCLNKTNGTTAIGNEFVETIEADFIDSIRQIS